MSRRCSFITSRSSSTIGRIASAPRSMIERPPIFTTCTQGRSRIGRPPATGRVRSESSSVWRASGEATCLAESVRSVMSISLRGDDGADMLAGERAGQVARDEAVHDLHLVDVTRRLEKIEHGEFEDRIVQALRLHLVDGDLGYEFRVLRRLRVRGIEAVLVLDVDHRLAAELLGDKETSSVGAIRGDHPLGRQTGP